MQMPIRELQNPAPHFYVSHIILFRYFTSGSGCAEIRREGRPRSILASMPRNKNTYTRTRSDV